MRVTELYRELTAFCAEVRQPGTGRISDAAQMHLSPGKDSIVFAATVAERVDEEPATRLALAELATCEVRMLTDGRHSDRLPRFSPDGRRIAFVSDREQGSGFHLHLYDLASTDVVVAARVVGQVEHLQWSADGSRILLRVVGPRDAETEHGDVPPPWMPLTDPGGSHDEWRSCWIYDVATDVVRRLDVAEGAIWEAAWCGDAIVTVASDTAGEDGWYGARLRHLDLADGRHRTVYVPQDQLGPPMAAPDGKTIAIVEGLCSDRGPVIGDLRLVDLASGESRTADLQGVDVVHGEWRSDRELLLSGYRGLASVIGVYDVAIDVFRESWSSEELGVTAGCIAGLGTDGDCVLIAEGFRTAPEIATILDGRYAALHSFDIGYGDATGALTAAEPVRWSAPDGLAIEGWLLRPAGEGPHPLVVAVHGGPVSHWRPGFMIRRLLFVPMLLRRGYAVFMPNPRGSSGRGQAFARAVMGDIGGADALDILAGVDSLVERGVADPARIGITGVSYGGFMTSWLITQSDRFAAAVSISPHTNQVTAHLLSNIPSFMGRLLGDEIGNLGGQYFDRSPVFRANAVRTPTLNIAGALDRCTPAGEAMQFHNALREAGIETALAVYPQEGHGVRRLPAAIDCTARTVEWLTSHMAAAGKAA